MVPDRDRADARKIHIRLLPDLHRRLRIRCAELDVTIQDFVVGLLERELGGGGRRSLCSLRPQGSSLILLTFAPRH